MFDGYAVYLDHRSTLRIRYIQPDRLFCHGKEQLMVHHINVDRDGKYVQVDMDDKKSHYFECYVDTHIVSEYDEDVHDDEDIQLSMGGFHLRITYRLGELIQLSVKRLSRCSAGYPFIRFRWQSKSQFVT